MYTFHISYVLRADLFLTMSQYLDNFEFVLAKESTRADQRNRLFPTDPNPNLSPDFKGIDSIPLDTISRLSEASIVLQSCHIRFVPRDVNNQGKAP
jgi:hypothetical protein